MVCTIILTFSMIFLLTNSKFVNDGWCYHHFVSTLYLIIYKENIFPNFPTYFSFFLVLFCKRKQTPSPLFNMSCLCYADSILFPDVPIALRLSSHLLLGVVRIYNRKVNYLFDDCSEALLKVKQAFRSTAVDLPPEESKAPYHSITLPETFDLDDFELPDNDIFHGWVTIYVISPRASDFLPFLFLQHRQVGDYGLNIYELQLSWWTCE